MEHSRERPGGRSHVALRLPPEAPVVRIAQDDEYRVPGGGTVLAAGDARLVLADEAAFARMWGRIEAVAGGVGVRS